MDTGHAVAAVGAGALAATGGEDFGPWVARTVFVLACGFFVRWGDRWLSARYPRRPDEPNA